MLFDPGRKYDAAIMSLCPGTGSAEGILRANGYSSGWCVHIMWIENCWDNLVSGVWKALGKDYSYEGRRNGLLESNLDSLGLDYSREVFEDDVSWEMPFEDIVARETRIFGAYGIRDAEEAVREVLMPYSDGDDFSFRCRNSMKLVVWRAERCCVSETCHSDTATERSWTESRSMRKAILSYPYWGPTGSGRPPS